GLKEESVATLFKVQVQEPENDGEAGTPAGSTAQVNAPIAEPDPEKITLSGPSEQGDATDLSQAADEPGGTRAERRAAQREAAKAAKPAP
ncbi:hypothetical protein, partial [Tsukamurella strandjordii]